MKYIYTKKGYLLLEVLISNFILIIISIFLIKIMFIIFDKRVDYNKDFKKMEYILNILEDISNEIELRKLVTDDFYLTRNIILIRKENDILKFEFEKNNLYFSILENSNDIKLIEAINYGKVEFKYRISIAEIERVEFFLKNNIIIIIIKDDDFHLERRVNL